jgi:hypothetical protein
VGYVLGIMKRDQCYREERVMTKGTECGKTYCVIQNVNYTVAGTGSQRQHNEVLLIDGKAHGAAYMITRRCVPELRVYFVCVME